MRTRLLAMVVAGLAALLGSAPVAASTAKFSPPKQYYLSLGDSLAFGYQHDLFVSELLGQDYSPADFPGYTYRFGELLQAIEPGLQVVDYGCPGETTVSFTTACAFQDVFPGVPLHDGYSGVSQQSAALAFLKSHRGAVGPITVSLGINDVTPLLVSCAPAFSMSCLAPPIAAMGERLQAILASLRSAASPNTEIIVMEYYDPYFVTPLGSTADALAAFVNSVIAQAAGSVGARLANAFAAINSSAPPGEAANVCYLTLMCSDADIHASDAGYAAIAGVFWDASGYQKLTG